jgi:hypothetical protein
MSPAAGFLMSFDRYRAANPFGITTVSQRRIALILDEAAEAAVEEVLIEAR